MNDLKVPADSLTPRYVGRKVTARGYTGTLANFYTRTLDVITLADTLDGTIVASVEVELRAPKTSIHLDLAPDEPVEIHGIPATPKEPRA